MRVSAVDIANLCVLYKEYNSRFISKTDLEHLFNNNMIIGNDASCSEVIDYTVVLKILSYDQNHDCYVINDIGMQIGRKQRDISIEINSDAAKIFVKKVYLNYELKLEIIANLVGKFNTDPIQKTYIYERPIYETSDESQILIMMNELKFFIQKDNKILVNKLYITHVREYLSSLSGNKFIDSNIESTYKKEIGEIAEALAEEFERDRMLSISQPELSQLVIKYGGLDDTKGYDIESYDEDLYGVIHKIYIEVKGTIGPQFKFTWSENEMEVAEITGEDYWLYCYRNVDIDEKTAEGPNKITDAYNTVINNSMYEKKSLKLQVNFNT